MALAVNSLAPTSVSGPMACLAFIAATAPTIMLTIQPTTASLMSLLIDIVSSSSPLGSFVVGPPSLAGWASRARDDGFQGCSLGSCRCRQRGPRRDGGPLPEPADDRATHLARAAGCASRRRRGSVR